MASPYANYNSSTPQTEALPGQSKNNAGGFSYTVDDWQRLTRFLILGSEGGTYYVGENKLTRENAKCVERCLTADGQRTVKEIIDISESGRAAKVQPAIFALALACAHPDINTRTAGLAAIGRVCRTGTHLFTFLNYVTNLRGKGTGLQKAIARWYNEKPVEKVAYQSIKYRNREGWTHRDALRISHPKPTEKDRKHLYNFICGRVNEDKIRKHHSLRQVEGYLKIQNATSPQEAAKLITNYKLPWETVPTEFHNQAVIWEAIYDSGALGLTACIRQLPRLTNLGVINTRPIAQLFTNSEALQQSRVHPLFILNAMATYAQGHGQGSTTWTPDRKIVDALDKAFYLAFGNVTPTGKRINLALDVSGSMGVRIANTNISAAAASCAMALITANVEPEYQLSAFSGDYIPITISPRQRLDDVVLETQRINFGRTDCSLPMRWALANKREFDTFVIYTDSETWAGREHPVESLRKYRQKMGIDAKLIVVGMTATQFTIADPNDAGMMDVVGFDTATPELISGFISDAY